MPRKKAIRTEPPESERVQSHIEAAPDPPTHFPIAWIADAFWSPNQAGLTPSFCAGQPIRVAWNGKEQNFRISQLELVDEGVRAALTLRLQPAADPVENGFHGPERPTDV
ncbi:MAG TPA: hypothetical protein VFO36_06445 [Nitrospiraceae bacterium]|nr:hypothetical protein [Nitrospiraceae bacterium]